MNGQKRNAARKVKALAQRVVSPPIYRRLMATWRWSRRRAEPIRWGNLRRQRPVSWFGFARGTPVDRYYIEQFLTEHRLDIRGRVLEVEDALYTRRFGDDRVRSSDVLHVEPDYPGASIVGNLATGEGVPAATFDCIILTQTLQFIYDVPNAIANVSRALKPGGVVLATWSGIGQLSRPDADRFGEYWRPTSLAARMAFQQAFPAECVSARAYGNLLSAVALLYGLASQDLTSRELNVCDPDYEVLVGVRAVRPTS
jgi:SAM-dependent methyltransferase